MSRKNIWILAIGYTSLVILLHNVLNTVVGAVLMQISSIAAMIWIIWFIYSLIKFSVRQTIYNYKHKDK